MASAVVLNCCSFCMYYLCLPWGLNRKLCGLRDGLMLAFGGLQMEQEGTLFQIGTMHVFHLNSFLWCMKVRKEKYSATSIEIKLRKLCDHDFKGLVSHVYINRFLIIN